MKKQQGFGLIEALVAMSLLSIATVATIKWFGIQQNNDAKIVSSTKRLQEQRFLERAIWAKYDSHSNAIDACNISTSTNQLNLSLDATNTCATGTSGNVWANAAAISDASCSYNSFTNPTPPALPTLTISGCSGSISTYASNINALTNKSEYKVTIWASNVNAQTCTLANIAMPAAAGTSLVLTMSADCTIGMSSATNPAARLPKYSVKLLGKGNVINGVDNGIDDGYQRFYY